MLDAPRPKRSPATNDSAHSLLTPGQEAVAFHPSRDLQPGPTRYRRQGGGDQIPVKVLPDLGPGLDRVTLQQLVELLEPEMDPDRVYLKTPSFGAAVTSKQLAAHGM